MSAEAMAGDERKGVSVFESTAAGELEVHNLEVVSSEHFRYKHTVLHSVFTVATATVFGSACPFFPVLITCI